MCIVGAFTHRPIVPLFWLWVLQVYTNTNTNTRSSYCPIILATSIHKHTHKAWLLSHYMYLGWHKCWRRLWQDCRSRAAILPRTREPAVPQFAPGGEEESPPGSNGDAVGSFENALRMQWRGIQRGEPTIGALALNFLNSWWFSVQPVVMGIGRLD